MNFTVLTYAERADFTLELIAAASSMGSSVHVVALALDEADAAKFSVGGAHVVLRVAAHREVTGPADAAAVLAAAVKQLQPNAVLIDSSRNGVEAAARLAQRLGAPCATGCLSVAFGSAGGVLIERRCYGGGFVARQALSGSPVVIAVQPHRYEPLAIGKPCEVRELVVDLGAQEVRTLSVRRVEHGSRQIEKAEAIVAVGRGLRGPEDLRMVQALAGRLDAEVAGSRPVTDDLRWLPGDVKVGLSGHTVKPKLYVACGISGQIEHIVGMRAARTVVAINKDPAAPIHAEADYSIVGDLYQVLPALTALLSR